MRDVHGVDDTHDIWLCKQAVSHRACQTVKTYFTEKLRVEAVPSPESEQEGSCIFLFRKSGRTTPSSLAPPPPAQPGSNRSTRARNSEPETALFKIGAGY